MKTVSPWLVARIGLAFTFFWAGISSFLAPEVWASYVPPFIGRIMPLETFLYLHAGAELAVGAAVLFGLVPKIAYALATVMLASILVFVGVDDVTFRDVGLAAMALALWLDAVRKE